MFVRIFKYLQDINIHNLRIVTLPSDPAKLNSWESCSRKTTAVDDKAKSPFCFISGFEQINGLHLCSAFLILLTASHIYTYCSLALYGIFLFSEDKGFFYLPCTQQWWQQFAVRFSVWPKDTNMLATKAKNQTTDLSDCSIS